MPRLAALAAALLIAALPTAAVHAQSAKAATPPAAAGAVHPGVYDLELAIGGGVLQGTLELTAAGDSLTAKLHVGDHEPPPVRSLTRTGSHVVLNVGGEGMKVIYELNFDGDAVSGTFTFNGDPGLVTGKRRRVSS